MGIIEQMNQPVDLAAEIKAYEEAEAVKRGEDVPETPLEDDPDSPPEEAPSADPDPAHQDDDAIDAAPKHQGNAWKTMRAKLKESEEALRNAREEMARRDGERRAWETFHQHQIAEQHRQQAQHTSPEPPIDPTVNPIDALQRLQLESQQMREMLQQQATMAEVQRLYRDDATRFMSKTPDFQAAYNHALTVRSKQLQLGGATAAQAAEQVRREEMDLAFNALQTGQSPAEIIYKYAREVYGFQGQPAQQPPRDDKGRFIQEQRKAQAATSISTGGKGAAESRTEILSDEEGAKLNGKAFDDWFEARDKQAKTSGGKKKIEWR